MDRALIAIGVLGLVALAFALVRRRPRPEGLGRVVPAELGLEDRSGVGVVGFSSPYCLPCGQWERELGRAGIAFSKVDVSKRPELARRYGVRLTPLVLAVRLPAGEVVERFHDSPEPDQVERLRGLVSTA